MWLFLRFISYQTCIKFFFLGPLHDSLLLLNKKELITQKEQEQIKCHAKKKGSLI